MNWWSVRAYAGDRIVVNMHITVNGKPAEVVNGKSNYKLSKHDSYTSLKERANEYDTFEYPLLIKSDDVTIPLNITVNHWNWWEIVESDLYIDIDTKTKAYTVYEEYEYTAEAQVAPVYYYISHENEPKETIKGIDVINAYAGCKG